MNSENHSVPMTEGFDTKKIFAFTASTISFWRDIWFKIGEINLIMFKNFKIN